MANAIWNKVYGKGGLLSGSWGDRINVVLRYAIMTDAQYLISEHETLPKAIEKYIQLGRPHSQFILDRLTGAKVVTRQGKMLASGSVP